MFAKVTITVPFALTLPTVGPLLGGEPNPFYPLILFLNDSVPKKDRYTYDGQTYTYHAEVLLGMFDLDIVGLLVSQQGDIYGLPLFFKVDLDAEVHPLLHSQELEAQPTWGEWFESQTHFSPTRKEDGYYTGTNVFDRNYLSGSQALALGIPLLTLPQLNALPAYQEPVPDEPLPE